MSKRKHEMHNLEGKKLPVIFHYNIVKKGGPEMVNWHDNIEILCCMAGSGQIICNSVEYDVEKGDLVVVNSNVIHGFRSDTKFEYYCLIVGSDFLAANDIPVETVEFESLVRSKEACALYENVVNEMISEKEYRAAGVRAQILNLMVYLARNHSTGAVPEEKNRGTSDESIKQAIAYIKSNYAQRLTLDEIADEVNLSKYYFAREFKKATGMTVVAYINAIRCRNAKKLLLSQKYSISEIASQCGFENNSYFSKTFKNVMGCLPSEVAKLS